MEIKTVLFDLDGTLTDSGPGIMAGVQYALNKYGMEVDDFSRLRCFIGPPLKEQFQKFCGFSDEEGVRAVEYYREYYRDKGIFENEVYDGISELLRELKGAGLKVIMATSKPEAFAVTIAEHFGISRYFDFIGGSLMDGRRTKKSEVIEYVLDAAGVEERSTVLMIGDRDYDILGAKEAGVHSLGVLYGYGSREELAAAGADFLAEKPEDVLRSIAGTAIEESKHCTL